MCSAITNSNGEKHRLIVTYLITIAITLLVLIFAHKIYIDFKTENNEINFDAQMEQWRNEHPGEVWRKVELTPKQYREFMTKGIVQLPGFDVPLVNKEVFHGKEILVSEAREHNLRESTEVPV